MLPVLRPFIQGSRPSVAGPGVRLAASAFPETPGSAEKDSDAMCLPVIGEHDVELAVEGDAVDRH